MAQPVVSADRVIVAAELTQLPVDTDCLIPMVKIAVSNVTSSGKAITTVLADAGYWSPDRVAKLDADLRLRDRASQRTVSVLVVPRSIRDWGTPHAVRYLGRR